MKLDRLEILVVLDTLKYLTEKSEEGTLPGTIDMPTMTKVLLDSAYKGVNKLGKS